MQAAHTLYFAERLTSIFGGAKIYLKREDLCHLGAHKKIIRLDSSSGKGNEQKNVIAETGAASTGLCCGSCSSSGP